VGPVRSAYHLAPTTTIPQSLIVAPSYLWVIYPGETHTHQPMFPTWVFGSPTGNETGDYLAVDLGGTNLRVCLVKLLGNSKFTLTQSKFRLTEEQKQGNGEELFDFCAQCVKDFIDAQIPQATTDSPVPLGFTFSYPCHQKSIDHGVLVRWTKGFGTSDVEGNDVAQLFRNSMQKLKVPAGESLSQCLVPSSLIFL
jgi:hexokinase